MEKTKKQVMGMGVMVLALLVCSCFFVGATFTNGEPGDTVTTTPPSSGGGSGGTSAGAITYTVNDEQFTQGYTKALRVGDGLRFSVAGESHNLKISSLTASTITIDITSELQQATLSVGDTRRFELSGDDYYDLGVTLNSINMTTSRAEITVLSINTEITDETVAEEQDKERDARGTQAEDESIEEGFFSFLVWVVIIILALVVALTVYFKRKKK